MTRLDGVMNLAIREAYRRQHRALVGGKQFSTAEQFEFMWKAGYAAGQTQWRPIRTADDLPKELDWYLFRDRLGGAKAELFNFQDWNMLNDITKGVFLMLYVAWQPIQPYTESDNTEVSDGRNQ